MSNAIEIKGLCKSYPGFSLDHLDLTLPGGTILGLIGDNGAGKSTTIKCILDLVHPECGSISVWGKDPHINNREVLSQIGVVFDECLFPGEFYTRDLEKTLAPCYKDWDKELFAHYLKKFTLPHDKKIKDFSRGMKMKLSLAAALAHRPRLLLLDEATAGLDPVVRSDILDEFQAFVKDEDHAILLSSHITSDIEQAADYVTYLHGGKVALSGAKDEILDSYGRVGCTAQQLEALEPGEALRVRRGEFGCELLVPDRAAFAKKHPDFVVDKPTLDEIMVFFGRGDEL